MAWVVLIIVVAIIAAFLDSVFGKVAIASGVVALGLLLLYWIARIVFLITLAKVCAAAMVIALVIAIITAIFS